MHQMQFFNLHLPLLPFFKQKIDAGRMKNLKRANLI
jgi:hypothetical protein